MSGGTALGAGVGRTDGRGKSFPPHLGSVTDIKEACDTEADKSEVGGVRRGPQGRVQRAGGT